MGTSFNIAVVGCGVAGTTAALLLARGGHRVTLFEQSPQVGPVGAGVLLQPSGQVVLQEMGLFDEVVSHAEPIDELNALTHRGHDLVRLRYGDLSPGTIGYGLHRGDLFTVLHRAILAAGVELRLNQTISTFEQDAGIRLNGGKFDLLIAADGSRSRLRAASRIGHWTWPYAHGALWAVGRSSAVRRQLLQITQGTRVLCGLLPMGDGRCSLFWGLPNASVDALHAGGFSAWRDTVLRLQPAAAEMFEAVDCFDAMKFVTYQHVHMSRWQKGRVVFIGDAAHAMSPHLGQGVNLALVDAWELVRQLHVEGRAIEASLVAYERSRRRQVATYGAVTFLLAPFFQSSVELLGWGRDRALPWFPTVPPVRRLMLRTLAGTLGA